MPLAAPSRPLPTVEALDRLWREVSARPLWRRGTLRQLLRLHWRMRLRLLDPSKIRLVASAGKVNDCACCTDICCIGPHATVLLRLRDVAMLMDIGKTDLMILDKPEFSSSELATRPALARQVTSRSWQTFPVLRKNRLGACVALDDDGRCSLHPHWPLACERFPYALRVDDRTAFFSPRCRSFWIRPSQTDRARSMAETAVEAYNARIKDALLLEYAGPELEELGLSRFLGHGR